MIFNAAGNDIILAVLAFGIILIPAIIIHELGHFFAAKLVGINVLEFGIGFPPRVGRLFRWGETDFTLNWLPIGGFVRPLGEDMIGPASDEKIKRDRAVLEARADRPEQGLSEREQLYLRGVSEQRMMSVNEAPPLGRIFFMAAGALANFATAMLLFFIVALIGLPTAVGGLAQLTAIPAGSLFADSPAALGDAIEMINGERFEDFNAFYDQLESYSGEEITFSLLRAETSQPYTVTVAAAFADPQSFVHVAAVLEDSPAATAGAQAGDLLTHINSRRLPATGDAVAVLNDMVEEYAGQVMSFTFLRDTGAGERQPVEIRVMPRLEPPEGEGRLGLAVRSQFGLRDETRFANAGYKTELIAQSISGAIAHSLETTRLTFELIASVPGKLLDGSLSGRDARPISIIGISKIGGVFLQRSLQEGPGLMLNFIALISIFLGVSNLLPIPALDGGRIVFVLLEILRGKPINPRLEARIHMIGIMLLMALGLVLMVIDLLDPPSIA